MENNGNSQDIPENNALPADPGQGEDSLAEKYAELQKKYDSLQRQNILDKVCGESGCNDPEYLSFCAARENVDTGNIDELRRFAGELAAASPGCFTARITPGSHANAGEKNAASALMHPAEAFTGDRIALIALSIDNAPDAVCR